MDVFTNRNRTGLGTLAALVLVGGLAAMTALPSSHAREDAGQTPQRKLTDEHLKMFAKAYVKVSEIYQAYQPRIIDAEDTDRARALQQEANEKMNQAVANEGLSVPEYNAIFSLVDEDERLQGQVNELLREQQ